MYLAAFFVTTIIKIKKSQMLSNSDLHMLLLIRFTDIMMTELYNQF